MTGALLVPAVEHQPVPQGLGVFALQPSAPLHGHPRRVPDLGPSLGTAAVDRVFGTSIIWLAKISSKSKLTRLVQVVA